MYMVTQVTINYATCMPFRVIARIPFAMNPCSVGVAIATKVG